MFFWLFLLFKYIDIAGTWWGWCASVQDVGAVIGNMTQSENVKWEYKKTNRYKFDIFIEGHLSLTSIPTEVISLHYLGYFLVVCAIFRFQDYLADLCSLGYFWITFAMSVAVLSGLLCLFALF